MAVKTDCDLIKVSAGEIAVIGCDQMHYLAPDTPFCSYYCLIPSVSLCGTITTLPKKTDSPDVIELYNRIIKEFTTHETGYIRLIEGYIACIFALLTRFCDGSNAVSGENSPKLIAVKAAMKYISENFMNDISVEDIAKSANLSRYYLCHVFKEITGQTVLGHLNYIRCNNACDLLLSGKYTVSQSAILSGFNNLSYFSKVYRAAMGHLPSKDAKK